LSRAASTKACCSLTNSMFEVVKPLTTIGIGFDNLPQDILSSLVLSKNDLGLLAGIEKFPNETDVNEYKLLELNNYFVNLSDDPSELEVQLHQEAKRLLDDNKLNEAWMTLLAFNN